MSADLTKVGLGQYAQDAWMRKVGAVTGVTGEATIQTGLKEVIHAEANINGDIIGDDPVSCNVEISNQTNEPGQIIVHVYKNASGSDPTLVDSTTSTNLTISVEGWGPEAS